MRVITGELRGKKLFSPADRRVRPTSDKVKESIFNMIAGYVKDAVVIDGFAGSGGLGIEAISRGANKVYFIDNNSDSIALIKKNIEHCHAQERCEVIFGSFDRAAERIADKADIIFLDPPYRQDMILKTLKLIVEYDMLADDGIIVAEHPHQKGKDGGKQQMQDELEEPLIKQKERRYGNICVTVYEKSTVSGDI